MNKEFPEIRIKRQFLITISEVYVISHHITVYSEMKSYHQNEITLQIE